MQTNFKTVIRNTNKTAGTYIIVSKHLIHNTNIKDFDVRLLLSILSDADDFIFNVTTYAQRFKCSPDKIGQSIKRLKEAGYIQQEQNKKRRNEWSYTISEFGNLSNEEKEPTQTVESIPTEHISEPLHDSTPTVESDVKVFDLKDYSVLIDSEYSKAIAKGHNINKDAYNEYLKTANAKGKLTDAKQMTSANLQVILKTLVIKPETKKEIETVVETPSIDYSVVTPVEDLTKALNQRRGYINMMQYYKFEKGINNGEITNLDNLLDLMNPNRNYVEPVVKYTKNDLDQWCNAKADKITKQQLEAWKLKVNEWYQNNPNATESQIRNQMASYKTIYRKACETEGN